MTLWDLVKRNMSAARSHHLTTGVLACLATALLTAALTVSGAIQKSFRENAVSRYGRIEAALISHAPLPEDLHTRLPRLEAEYLTVPVWEETAVATPDLSIPNAEDTPPTGQDHDDAASAVAPSTDASSTDAEASASHAGLPGKGMTVPCRVYAVPPAFGKFGWHGTRLHLDGNAVAIGEDLAQDLGVRVGDTFTLHVPVSAPVPHDAVSFPPPPALTLLVKEILRHPAPGAFSLRHDRIDTYTLFIDHAWYMQETHRDAVANRLFFGSAQDTRLRLNHRAVEITLQGTLTIADYGMTLAPEPGNGGVWRLTGADLPPVMHTLRQELHPFLLEDNAAPDALRFRMTPATSFDDYIAHRPRNERERLKAMPPEESFDLFLREALWNSILGYRLSMLHDEAKSAGRGSLGFAGFSVLLLIPLLLPMGMAICRVQRRAYGHLRPVMRVLLTLGFTHDQTRGQVLTGGLAAALAGVVPGALLGLALSHAGVAYLGQGGATLVADMPMRLLPDFLFLSTGIGGGMVFACAMVWLAARPAKRWTLLSLRETDMPRPARHAGLHTPAHPSAGGDAPLSPASDATEPSHTGGTSDVRAVIKSARVWVALLCLIYLIALGSMLVDDGRRASSRPSPGNMTVIRTILPLPLQTGVQREASSPTGDASHAVDGNVTDGHVLHVGGVSLHVGLLVEGESIAPGTPTRPLRPGILGLPPRLLEKVTLHTPDGEGAVRIDSGRVLGEKRADHLIPAAANGYSAYWLLHRGLGTHFTVPGLRGASVPAHMTGAFHSLPAADTVVMSAENVRRHISHLPAARVLLLPSEDPEVDILELVPEPIDPAMILRALAPYHPTLHTLGDEFAAYQRWVAPYRRLLQMTLAAGLLLLLALEMLLVRIPAAPLRLPLQPDPERG